MGLFQSFFGKSPGGTIESVNAVELNDLLQESEKEILLVDVRSPAEYVHDGHIEGAQLIPLQQLMQKAGELPEDQEIVCVCRSGNRSMVACRQMAQLGFSNVKNFNGGMIAWQTAGLPVSY
jgi:rhodanese-related sulfurtransferase